MATLIQSLTRTLCFCSLATFLLSTNAQETQRQYLSGRDKDNTVPWEFQCTSGAHSGYWTNIPVPSQWDVLGFGSLNYGRDPTNAYNEHGLYAHDFSVPANWNGQRVFLVFEGSMTDTSAQVNGQSAGPTHQGSFYRFKYDITSLVKIGESNHLEVDVAKHSANPSVNAAERQADYWVFGGIFRPVYLEAQPQQFIERVAIDAKASGDFAMDVYLNGATNVDSIEAQFLANDGKEIGAPFKTTVAGDTQAALNLKSKISSPKTWTAETPNLYSVEVRLKSGDAIVHRFTQRFGFRTMEVRAGDGLYLNGQRVILKGADRHSFWPESGRCLSEAVHRMDIEALKDANMNAVRMSHYPPDQQFLDLCDELGIYVLDELAGWHNHYDTEVGTKLVHEMLARDVNHPAILFWDNGNEGGWNTNLDHIYPELDPQKRHVLHPWALFDNMNTAHYLHYDQAVDAAAGIPMNYRNGNKTPVDRNPEARHIYMPTEFVHGLYDGGAGSGLDDYWKLMMSSKYLGGGFIWVLADEGVKRPDTGKIDVAGNQAPDGIVGPYREREGSFYAVKEIWSPIQITRDDERAFTVKNHYSFTDASQCEFTAELRSYANPNRLGAVKTTRVEMEKVSVPPGGTGKIQLRLPARADADILALRVNDPKGRELWTWTWPVTAKNRATDLFHEPAPQRANATDSADSLEVKAGDLSVTFNKQSGLLTSVRRGSQPFSFTNGPISVRGTSTLSNFQFTQDGPDYVISEKFSGALKSVTWRVNGNGWLQCDYTYAALGTNEFFGVLFDYPETQVKHKRWLGDGPYHVWQNRLRGVNMNVWENDYNDTIAGYRGWIYPEFKGFFANVRWLQLDTSEGSITVVNNNNVPFMQIFPPEFPPARLMAQAYAIVPGPGLGFLDAIPAIGSKFRGATSTGPQGQPAIGKGDYSGSVSFYFGKLP